MEEGLLVFDDNPDHNLDTKVALAAARYKRKFGTTPNTCYVHPSAEPAGPVGCVEVKPLSTVLKHHFWIGRETPLSHKLHGDERDDAALERVREALLHRDGGAGQMALL